MGSPLALVLPSNGDLKVIPLLLAVPPQLAANVKVFDERPAYIELGTIRPLFPLYAGDTGTGDLNPAKFRHTV